MKRELSTKLTILTKIILPVFSTLVMCLITLTMFLGAEQNNHQPPPKFQMLGATAAVAAFFYFTVMRFMRVHVDEKFLYVSNFLKEISIPLAGIRDVTEIVWLRGHPITIHLRDASEFGSKITFLPKSKGFKFFQPHPVVAELKETAQAARAKYW